MDKKFVDRGSDSAMHPPRPLAGEGRVRVTYLEPLILAFARREKEQMHALTAENHSKTQFPTNDLAPFAVT